MPAFSCDDLGNQSLVGEENNIDKWDPLWMCLDGVK
jgi:hypothetical protein